MQYPRLVMATVSVAAGSALLDPPSMSPPTLTGLVHWQIHILQIPLLIQSITYKERSQLWKNTNLTISIFYKDTWVRFARWGKISKMWHLFILWSFNVTKWFDFFNFFQLFWRDFFRWSLKIPFFILAIFLFWIFYRFTPIGDFWQFLRSE